MPTAEDYRAGIAELDRRVDDLAAVAFACDRTEMTSATSEARTTGARRNCRRSGERK